jgi:hypothetical protein
MTYPHVSSPCEWKRGRESLTRANRADGKKELESQRHSVQQRRALRLRILVATDLRAIGTGILTPPSRPSKKNHA